MNRRILAALALALLPLCAAPAHAGVQASASVTNISLAAVDLDPNDGTAARYIVRRFASTEADVIVQGVRDTQLRNRFLAPIDVALADALSTGHAHGTSSSLLADVDFEDPFGYVSAFTTSAAGLLISPHTAVTLSARYDQLYSAVACDWAHVACSGYSLIQFFANGQETRFELDASPDAQSRSGVFSMTLTNDSDQWIASNGFAVVTSTLVNFLPIPEPATGALWACGLLCVAGAARRRKPRGPSRCADPLLP